MALGDTVWLALDVEVPEGRLYVGLCGDDACSVVRVRGADGNTMGYSTALLTTNSVSGRGDDLQEVGDGGTATTLRWQFESLHDSYVSASRSKSGPWASVRAAATSSWCGVRRGPPTATCSRSGWRTTLTTRPSYRWRRAATA